MENSDIKKSDEGLRCENCNSNQTYIRIKSKEKVCKRCGHIQLVGKND